MSKILFFLMLLPLFLFAKSGDYILGSGYKVPFAPIYLGGYFSTEYENNKKPKNDSFSIDDIAFLGYGSYKNFAYLAELETVNLYKKEFNENGDETLDTSMHIERLYVDYSINEAYKLRIGKFITPVGYWNLTPINVLRETTSNPVMSYIIYPKYTMGLNLNYEYLSDREVKVDFIVQNSNDIDEKHNNIQVNKHYAIGIEQVNDLVSFKINGGYFHSKSTDKTGRDFYYGVVSFLFDNDTLKISGEFGSQFSNHTKTVPYAMYLQAAYTLHEKHYAIVRVEHYKQNNELSQLKDSAGIFAYTYRPLYPIAIKIEYQIHSDAKLNKFMASFSVLF